MPAYTEAKAKQVIDRALSRALGGSRAGEASAALSSSVAGNTRFAVNEITSSSDLERATLSITIQYGKRVASSSTNQFDDRSLDDVLARTRQMAKLAPENPEAMPPLGRQTYKRTPGAVDNATAMLGPDARAKAAGAAIQVGDAAKVQIAGFYEHASRSFALGTSAGLWAYHAYTSADLTCTARTTDGTGSGWGGASSHRAADFDPAALAKIAVDKAVKSAKPAKLDPGRYTVILEPQAVADLLGWLTGALGARRADEGRSFFSKAGGGTRVGDKLFPETITLRSDPGAVRLNAWPFDREGLPLAPTSWFDKGVLKGLVYGRYWAKKQGKPATGQPGGWVLDGGKATTEELLKGVKRGVLITRLWYLRSLDPQSILVTGLTRDGVFLVENGAVTRPVTNFRFNESPVQMLGKCDAMTPSVVAGNMLVPALRTHDFNLASISEAV